MAATPTGGTRDTGTASGQRGRAAGGAAALLRCEILDTPPEPAFDDLVRLAARVCDAPISFVSLVDAERQWFKARLGFDTPETARDIAFCAHTILGDDLLIVPDTLADERFADNPLVTAEPHIRFYAGAPLVTVEGHALGTICVVDRVPRTITDEQHDALRALARQAVALLELRRHERERKAFEHMQTVLDHAPVAVYIKDLEGRFLFANRHAGAVAGVEAEEMIGKTTADLFPAEFATPLQDDDARALAEGDVEIEERIPRPDGVHTFLSRKFALLDAEGAPYALCGISSDITDRTQAEEKKAHLAADVRSAFRHADEARLRLEEVLERVTDGFVALDNEWRYTYINERGAALFGRRPEELVGKHIWEEFPEGVDQPFYHAYHRAIAEQQPILLEDYYEPWDRWFENRIYPSSDGLTIFYQEITERKKAEEAVARANAERQAALEEAAAANRRAAELLEQIQDGFTALDTEWHYTYVNSKGAEILGCRPEALVGRNIWDVFPTALGSDFHRACEKAVAEQEAQEVANYFELWDRWFENRIYPSSGGLAVFYRDVTERKAAEEALARARAERETALEEAAAANEQAAQVLERLTDGFLALDTEWRITYVNEHGAELIGGRPEELTGRDLWEVVPEAVGTAFHHAYHRAMAEQVPLEIEQYFEPWGRWFENRIYPSSEGLTIFFHEITERKKAEEALATARAERQAALEEAAAATKRAADVLDRVTDVVMGWDREWRCTFVNAQALAQGGVTEEEFVGRRMVDVISPEAATGLREWGDRAMRYQQPLAYRGTWGSPERFLDVRFYPAPDGLTVVSRDETDRYRAEQDLHRLASLVDASTDFIGLSTFDGHVLYLNAGGRRLVGLDDDADLFGRHITDFVVDRTAALWPSEVGPALRTRGSWEGTLSLRNVVTGEEISTLASAFVIRDPDTGEPVATGTVIRDVREQQWAEQQIRDLAAVIDHSPFWVNLAGPDEQITYVNPAGRRLVGIADDADVTRLRARDLAPEARHAEWEAEVRGQVTAQGYWQGRFWLRNFATGAEIPARGTVFALRSADSEMPSGFACILQDTTAEELLEEQLARTQRLESLGLLAGGIAHDFNNLLAVILNYASFIGREGAGNEAVVRDAGQITAAAESGADLVKQLLTFAGRASTQPRVIDLGAEVARVEDLLRRVLGEQAALTTEVDADLWPVEADPGRLEQVMVNLAVNARDAMIEGGRLTITAANVEAGAGSPHALEPGRYVRLTVTDTGCGMTDETRERAFEPFFTTKPKGIGTGLGLSTVHGIVTRAGGTVELQSTPGEGTTVTILLPAAEEPTAEAAAAEDKVEETETVPRGSGEQVLVVEDDAGVRESTRRMLADGGYSVAVAADGAEALARIEAGESADLVLSDVVMPNLSGPALVTALTARSLGLPVLLMSGFASSGEDADLTAEQRDNLLQKPFSEAELLRRVRAALDAADRS